MKKSLIIKIIAIVLIAIILCIVYYIFSTKYLDNNKDEMLESDEIVDIDKQKEKELKELLELESDDIDNNQSCKDEIDKKETIDNSVFKDEENIDNNIGMLAIPDINLLQSITDSKSYENAIEECVDSNICLYSIGDSYSDQKNHIILYDFSDRRVNGVYRNIDKLKKNSYVYIKTKDKIYKYKLINQYSKAIPDNATLRINDNGSCKQLTIITHSKGNPTKYYSIINFSLVNEK